MEEHNPTFCRRLRGKCAKEVYRYGKAIIITRSIIKPTAYALARIPGEVTKGYYMSRVGDVGEIVVAYCSGLTCLRGLYVVAKNGSKAKRIFRFCYNVVFSPMSIASFSIDQLLEFMQIGNLEKLWFGERVHLLHDYQCLIGSEGNFTFADIFDVLK